MASPNPTGLVHQIKFDITTQLYESAQLWFNFLMESDMASESFKEKLRTKDQLEHYRKEAANPKYQPDKTSKYFLKKIGINDLELSIGHFQV